MTEVFRVVLRDVKRYDTLETRAFDLPLGSSFPIGRASKNTTKSELLPAPHNAYIDSPVISRNHAVLSANASSGKPDVYISDCGSMHGTLLNGKRLPANKSTKLVYGDELQFGTDVNRNDDFFVARTYTFESQLSRPFSLGFTVPDAESEEEDVAERRGSQTDPFIIDDSDSASQPSEVDAPADTEIIIEEVTIHDEPALSTIRPQDDLPEPAWRETVDEHYDVDQAQDAASVANIFELHRDDSLISPSPSESDEEALETDFDSEAASIGSSAMDYDSGPEVQDTEDEDMDEFPESDPFEPSTAHEAQPSATASALPMEQSPTIPRTVQPLDVFGYEKSGSTQASLPPLGFFSHRGQYLNLLANGSRASIMNLSNLNDTQSSDSASSMPSSAPKPAMVQYVADPFTQPSDTPSWYPEEMPQQNYMGTNFGDRPSLYSPAPPRPVPESVEARVPTLFGNYSPQMLQADRLQTPPPMPASDVVTSTPPQPSRRTKVTIEEIVEEQPPTPESVNNMKRKAYVLEAEEPVEVQEKKDVPVDVIDVAEQTATVQAVAAPGTQTSAAIAQRPKAVPHSRIRRMMNKAAYPLIGATGAVASFALLSVLPDAFFT